MRPQSCDKAMGWCTAQYEMLLFSVKTIVKESCNLIELEEERKSSM